MKMRKISASLLALLLALILTVSSLTGCEILDDSPISDNPIVDKVTGIINDAMGNTDDNSEDGSDGDKDVGDSEGQEIEKVPSFESLNDIPSFSGIPYVVLNDNNPTFTASELVAESYESYSELDSLGRCGVAEACVGKDIMPTEDRESIGSVKPSGWQSVKYDIVDGKYLYNRCHLIGFQLTGENANKQNLITGTRYMNVDGMLPFENMIADYVKETENHVLYRVTPIFEGNELVARGAVLEAYSVEDNGEGICFHVYVYNAQPGIVINYATGESALEEEGLVPPDYSEDSSADTEGPEDSTEDTSGEVAGDTPVSNGYVLNTSTKKFHYSSCSSAKSMSSANKEEYTGDRDTLIAQGYSACGICKP